ncbi:stretch-activated Ca2+-permeable channel component-domain-containing protein [Xylariaceae sp. FL0255]|nr:stretch-activated Ca2+-permeable channel component-domain-containing protein [Xylariaceae sp. FL0255]
MQLSPLQSRLAASMIASFLLLILYLILFAPPFAFAAELPDYQSADTLDAIAVRDALYEPDFPLFDRSIIGRAPATAATSIQADVAPTRDNINSNETITFVFQLASVSGRSAQPKELRRSLNDSDDEIPDANEELDDIERRQATQTVWISANTCQQPARNSSSQTNVDPPQLTLYVSTSTKNTSPGPGQDDSTQDVIAFSEGAVNFKGSTSHDVYFSISAPSLDTKDFSTALPYNFAVSVSLNEYYYTYSSEDPSGDTPLIWVDSDSSAAFFKTDYINSDPSQPVITSPYTLFVQNNDNVNINGMHNSYCGLSQFAQIRPLDTGSGQLTTGLKLDPTNNLTLQEFYISGLNASSNYVGMMAKVANSTSSQKRQSGSSSGSVTVYNAVSFNTQPEGPCTFIFNLTLCTETQYAVPGNSTNFPNATALAAFYDDYTQSMYNSFELILQQTPCQPPNTQKYSLVRDCDDCKQTYKDWLCSVAIPRCEDFSAPDKSFLQMRNILAPFGNGTVVPESITSTYGNMTAFNSSRNPQIDTVVQPGPYKEVLPCDYLCYNITKSCPASMGFGCPLPSNKYSFFTSYASPNQSEGLSCNYPGSAYYPSAAAATTISWTFTILVIGFALLA